MADLDDFFAKKDKKKSKPKKFLTQEELREKLEDNSKKTVPEPVKAKFQEENGGGANTTEISSKDDEVSVEGQLQNQQYRSKLKFPFHTFCLRCRSGKRFKRRRRITAT